MTSMEAVWLFAFAFSLGVFVGMVSGGRSNEQNP